MPLGVTGKLVSWATCFAGFLSCPALPGRSAMCPDPTHGLYVGDLDSTGHRHRVTIQGFCNSKNQRNTITTKEETTCLLDKWLGN